MAFAPAPSCDRSVFEEAQKRWGACSVDAFSSPATALLPRFWTATPQPGSAGTDAFTQTWGTGSRIWAHPPADQLMKLIDLLNRRERTAEVIVCAPEWASSRWYIYLSAMCDEKCKLLAGKLQAIAQDAPQRIGEWPITLFHIPPRVPSLAERREAAAGVIQRRVRTHQRHNRGATRGAPEVKSARTSHAAAAHPASTLGCKRGEGTAPAPAPSIAPAESEPEAHKVEAAPATWATPRGRVGAAAAGASMKSVGSGAGSSGGSVVGNADGNMAGKTNAIALSTAQAPGARTPARTPALKPALALATASTLATPPAVSERGSKHRRPKSAPLAGIQQRSRRVPSSSRPRPPPVPPLRL